MGQLIAISSITVDGDVAAFHTDRSITGQDGVTFGSRDAAEAAGTFPGDLAVRLFDADAVISHIFVASNQVVVGRDGGWNDSSRDAAAGIVTRFFVFYADA